MKLTLQLLFILFLGFSEISAQIRPFQGIYNLDSCDFESGSCQYVSFTNDSNNVWQLGKPNKVLFDSAYSGNNAIVTDTTNSYPVNNHSYFDVRIVSKNNAPYGNRIISFKHKFDTDSLKDGGYIEVSYDNGNTWNNVIYQNGDRKPAFFATENMYSSNDSLINGKVGFSGKSKGWIYSRIQWVWVFVLKQYSDTIILRFNFLSDSIQTNKAGWIIDDFMISYVDQGSGVNNISKRATYLEISPNPINENTKINLIGTIGSNYNITLLNSLGQTVKNIDIIDQKAILNNQNLKQGIYFVQLKKEEQVLETKKIIVE
jgi:hypothetical protein